MNKRYKQIPYERCYTNGKQRHKKMFNKIHYWKNKKLNRDKILPLCPIEWQKLRKYQNVGKNLVKLGISYIAAGV